MIAAADRLLLGEQLPAIRAHVEAELRRRSLDRERVTAAMLRIVHSAAIRIGSEEYAVDNDSFGLSTLAKRHARIVRGGVELAFPAKSKRRIRIVITDRPAVRAVSELLQRRSRHLFAVDGEPVTADDVNARLAELAGEHITAKDFRPWRGTLAAFRYLRGELNKERPPERVAIDALDQAAAVLGNTRAVARAHYVHPHMVLAFTGDRFAEYLDACRASRYDYLDDDECALLEFLRVMLEREFDLKFEPTGPRECQFLLGMRSAVGYAGLEHIAGCYAASQCGYPPKSRRKPGHRSRWPLADGGHVAAPVTGNGFGRCCDALTELARRPEDRAIRP